MTHLLCLGDSITDCGRLFSPNPFGDGYVKVLFEMFSETGHPFSIENKGIDGFTLARLLRSLDTWLNASDPDIITVLIGINDLGIMMNTDRTPAQQQTLLQEFFARYEILAQKLSSAEHDRSLFFLEPFIFPWPRCYAAWLPLLSRMSAGIFQISRKYSAAFVPLQDDLNQEAVRIGFDRITTDGIHLTDSGHTLLAKKLYTSISERAHYGNSNQKN